MPLTRTHQSVATQTDHEGIFTLRGVPAGGFALRLHHDDFADRIVHELSNGGADVALPPLLLEPGAVIRGRFRSPRQLGRLTVTLAAAVMCEGSFFTSFWAETTSDAEGRFRLPDRVPAGCYVLLFSPLYQRDAHKSSLPLTWRLPVSVRPEERTLTIDSSIEAAIEVEQRLHW